MRRLGRRRCLAILAASAASPALSAGAGPAPATVRWSGIALGARAEIVLRHPDRERAAALMRSATAEISRLERIFSLFDPTSALVRLNHEGRLDAPPLELVDLLRQVQAIHQATDGTFDPTIQPLWRLHAEAAASGRPPPATSLRDARATLGLEQVRVATDAIAFSRPGMALTLNGIAQGFITDQIADLLRAGGLDHVLVDLGEIRALGEAAPGRPWRIGLAERGDGEPDAAIDLADGAIATSSPFGTTLDAEGHIGHIIDPRTGDPSPGHWRRVSVRHPRAAIADGLSTAFVLLEKVAIDRALERFPGALPLIPA